MQWLTCLDFRLARLDVDGGHRNKWSHPKGKNFVRQSAVEEKVKMSMR